MLFPAAVTGPICGRMMVPSGWIGNQEFFAGYGVAQMVPGPLFSFGAYLGWAMQTFPNGFVGASLGLVFLFAPGLLIVIGALPFWTSIRQCSGARAVLLGINAAVVGLLGAALYDPIGTSAIHTLADAVVALTCLVVLVGLRMPPLGAVALCVLASMVFATTPL